VDRLVKKAFGILDLIAQNIEYRGWDVLLKLYTTTLGILFNNSAEKIC